MTIEPSDSPPTPGRPPRGRPLDRSRDEHILRITVEALNEIGIAGLRMQDVAERAGVGLGTIYRRWPTKEYLVIAALKAVIDQHEADADHPPPFREQALGLGRMLRGKQADLVPGVVAAMYTDPLLADTFRASWLDPAVEALRAALQAQAASPLPDETVETIAAIIPAFLTYRLLMSHEPIEDADLDRLIETVVMPLLAVHSEPRPAPARKRRTRQADR